MQSPKKGRAQRMWTLLSTWKAMPAQYPTCNQPMHFQGATLAISNCIGKCKRLKLLQWGKFSWRLLCNKTADFYDVFPQSTAFALACYKVHESVKYNSMTFGRVGKQRQRAKEQLKLQPNCALCLQQMNLTKGSSKTHTTVDGFRPHLKVANADV